MADAAPKAAPPKGASTAPAQAATPAGATEALVDSAFDASKHAALAEAIEQLSPEEAAFFLERLERALRKRKLQLAGYLAAMVLWLVGMVAALIYYGSVDRGQFVGWVFLVPFAVVGVALWGFGKWAERIAGPGAPPAKAKPTPAQASLP
jgi:hypothetical protein